MAKDIAEAISGCEACVQAKNKKQRKTVVLHQTSTAEPKRLLTWYTDIIGPWPSTSEKDFRYLLTFQDAVTKYPEAVPIKNISAETVTRAIGENIVSRYGAGITLISDQGTQFTSSLLKRVCNKLGIIKSEISAFHPQANPVERMHRTFTSIIRAMMFQEKAHPSDWHLFVPYVLAAIRLMPLSNLPGSPHFLTYGQTPITPTEVYLATENETIKNYPSITQMLDRFKMIEQIIYQQQQENHERNKKLHDKNVKTQDIQPGDWVYVFSPGNPRLAGHSRKLLNYQQGPYKVLKILNDTTIQMQQMLPDGEGMVTQINNVNKQRVIKVPPTDISKELVPLSWTIGKRKPIEVPQRSIGRQPIQEPEDIPATSQFLHHSFYFPTTPSTLPTPIGISPEPNEPKSADISHTEKSTPSTPTPSTTIPVAERQETPPRTLPDVSDTPDESHEEPLTGEGNKRIREERYQELPESKRVKPDDSMPDKPTPDSQPDSYASTSAKAPSALQQFDNLLFK
jgi:hypothetical protein